MRNLVRRNQVVDRASARVMRWSALLAFGLVGCGLVGCGVDVQGDDPPLDQLFDPVGIALDPTGESLYVVNGNFNVLYRQDRGGTVTRVDADTLEVDTAATAQIGTFGGQITIPAHGQKAYIAVRGDRSLTVLDIDEQGRLSCAGERQDTAGCRLGTGSDDPFGVTARTATRVQRVAGTADCPTEQQVDSDGDGAADACDRNVDVDLIAVAHLVGSNVTAFSIRGGDINTFSRVSSPVAAGANDLALSPRNGDFYATSRFDNSVVAFRLITDPDSGDLSAVFQTAEIDIDRASPFAGFDSRGIAFSGDGERAYVANRGPKSLLVLDVGPTDVERGTGSRNRMVDQIPMPSQPADVVVATVGDRELVYVASYAERRILVVDPAVRAVVDRIDLPGSPYALLVDDWNKHRIYVTLFEQGQIAIVDIDPESASFHAATGVIQ